MKFMLKVALIFVLGVSTANANILGDIMNMGQNQGHNSRNGWVKVSIPDDISDKSLAAKLAQYPSISVKYLNQHEDRINGVQNVIYETLMNTNSESQYRKYFKLARTLGMRDLPRYNDNGFDNLRSKFTDSDDYRSNSNRSLRSSVSNYEDEDSGNVRVPGLY